MTYQEDDPSPGHPDCGSNGLLAALHDANGDVARYSSALASAGADLEQRFLAGESVVTLVRRRATTVDEVLSLLWSHHMDARSGAAALVAVGGFGRGELHPFSDVDVMVLIGD